MKIMDGLRSLWFSRLLHCEGVFGKGIEVHAPECIEIGWKGLIPDVDHPEAVAFPDAFSCGRNCLLSAAEGKLKIGRSVSLNNNVHINADFGSIQIEDHVLIGPNVVIRAGRHRASDRQTVIASQGHEYEYIRIQSNVWIGANAVITGNVIVDEGAIIGAGAVVIDDVEAYTIAGGVPAKRIGWRR